MLADGTGGLSQAVKDFFSMECEGRARRVLLLSSRGERVQA